MCSGGGGGGPSIGDTKILNGVTLTFDGNDWIDKAKEAAAAAEAKLKAEAAAAEKKLKAEADAAAAEWDKKKQELNTFSDKNTQSIPTSEEIQGIVSKYGEHYSLEGRKFMGELLGEEHYQGSMLDRMLSGETTMQEAIENQYQGGELDQILELGQYVWNDIVRASRGEKTKTETAGEEAAANIQEKYGDDVQVGIDNVMDVVNSSIGTMNETLDSIGHQVTLNTQEATGGGSLRDDVGRGGDVDREDDLLTLDKKKSTLKAKKKEGKKGLRVDYALSVPGGGKSGIAA